MVDCTFYILSLSTNLSAVTFLSKIQTPLISGVPHGWVLGPHSADTQDLVGREWDLFILIDASSRDVEAVAKSLEVCCIKGNVSVPQSQYDDLVNDVGKPAQTSNHMPSLAQEWNDGRTGKIPERHVLAPKEGRLLPGELKLYEPMATYLSTALPDAVRDKPVSLFNLFKYHKGNPGVHEHYMHGFKEKFGPAAGAQLKFMGPISSQPTLFTAAQDTGSSEGSAMGWQDANFVQYDSIWHYAYMLSTDVYRELNKEKVRGLEDTCILLISEAELQQ